MARIRTIKPEFWADEKLSQLDPLTRLVFVGLISLADDRGRLVDNVKLLDGQLFPHTSDSCADALDTLARYSRVLRYTSASGQSLIQIVNWEKHQKVDKPAKYSLPGPSEAQLKQVPKLEVLTGTVAGTSRNARESVATPSRSDLGPTTNDLGPRSSSTSPTRIREVGEALREKLSEPHNVAAVERFLTAAPTDQRAAAMEAKLLTWLSGHDWPPGPKLTPNAAASGLAEYLDEPGDFSAAHVLAFLLRTVRQWHKHSEQLASGAAEVPAKAQQEAQAIWGEMKRSGVLYATTPREWKELAKAIAGTEVVKSVEHFGQIWREFDLPFLRAASTERAAIAHIAEALSRVRAAA